MYIPLSTCPLLCIIVIMSSCDICSPVHSPSVTSLSIHLLSVLRSQFTYPPTSSLSICLLMDGYMSVCTHGYMDRWKDGAMHGWKPRHQSFSYPQLHPPSHQLIYPPAHLSIAYPPTCLSTHHLVYQPVFLSIHHRSHLLAHACIHHPSNRVRRFLPACPSVFPSDNLSSQLFLAPPIYLHIHLLLCLLSLCSLPHWSVQLLIDMTASMATHLTNLSTYLSIYHLLSTYLAKGWVDTNGRHGSCLGHIL